MDRKTLIKQIYQRASKPEAIVFEDTSGFYFAGEQLLPADLLELKKTHAVKTIQWIEYEPEKIIAR
jgi:hypothetical protein